MSDTIEAPEDINTIEVNGPQRFRFAGFLNEVGRDNMVLLAPIDDPDGLLPKESISAVLLPPVHNQKWFWQDAWHRAGHGVMPEVEIEVTVRVIPKGALVEAAS